MGRVCVGLDVLTARRPRFLRGRRVGLVCHQASVDAGLGHAAEAIAGLPGVRLAALFAPEHGLGGAAQDHARVPASRDRRLGVPVHSLYGARLAPDPRTLDGLDVLVVDLQDVGARYYTFVWTMALAMRAAAAVGVPVVVLDRPNPLGGVVLEGNRPDPRFASFVGLHPLPIRHGLTIGELAAYLNATHRLGADLTVVPMRGWRRAMRWEDTGCPWVAPSPNMPTPDTARVYPGGCLLEGTNLSEGRGTTRPFELVGAPFLDGHRLAAALDRRRLPGVAFRPAAFQPTFHKHAGRLCGGVQVHVVDAGRFRPVTAYVALMTEARRQAPRRFRWRRPPYEFVRDRLPIDLLSGGPEIRVAVERGTPPAALGRRWRRGLTAFARARRPYLAYA